MAFIVVAPLVSRVMPAHAAMQGMAGMMGSDCPHVAASSDHAENPAKAADRCGYCVLLDHQSLLAAHVILHLLPAPPRTLTAAALRETDIREAPREDARPRGPPRLS